VQQKCTRLGRRARLKCSSRGVEFASRTKSYAIESKTTAKRGISRVSSVLKISAKNARTRGRLFYFTFEAFFYKFVRLMSRTSANVVTKIERGIFATADNDVRERRFFFFFCEKGICEHTRKAPLREKEKSVTRAAARGRHKRARALSTERKKCRARRR
jgi:hypothetical protein